MIVHTRSSNWIFNPMRYAGDITTKEWKNKLNFYSSLYNTLFFMKKIKAPFPYIDQLFI